MRMRPAAVVPTGSIAFFTIVLFYRTKTGLHTRAFFILVYLPNVC